jgi:NAD(P)-dependent dehydrogenase (short-subunit alcohol dehydrogenase family)
MQLAGKTAVITRAASGIGLACISVATTGSVVWN